MQNGTSTVPEPLSEQDGLRLSTYSTGANCGGGGGVPIVVESSTAPCWQLMSSPAVDGPQTASIRMPSLLTSTRRCSRWNARNARRGSVVVHGVSRFVAPPVVTWVTPLIGWKRS